MRRWSRHAIYRSPTKKKKDTKKRQTHRIERAAGERPGIRFTGRKKRGGKFTHKKKTQRKADSQERAGSRRETRHPIYRSHRDQCLARIRYRRLNEFIIYIIIDVIIDTSTVGTRGKKSLEKSQKKNSTRQKKQCPKNGGIVIPEKNSSLKKIKTKYVFVHLAGCNCGGSNKGR